MPRASKSIDDVESEISLASLTYFPAYMRKAHPLQKDWVKIPASLINKLHVPPGWEASHPGLGCNGAAPMNSTSVFPLFHYLNHPLPFVQLCGIVVDLYEPNGLNARVIQLDDSSGDLVDVVVKKVVDPDKQQQRKSNFDLPQQDDLLQKGDVIPKHVVDWLCCSWMGGIELDIRSIQIGSILRVKGRVSPWKKGRQLLLERFDIFKSTLQEINFWNQMAEEFNSVLCKPWVLTVQQQEELRIDLENEKLAAEKRARRLARKAQKDRKARQTAGDRANVEEQLERSEMILKTAEHKGINSDPQDKQDVSSDPANHGLAPSYQLPKNDTPSFSNSSGNSKSPGLDGTSHISKDEIEHDDRDPGVAGVALGAATSPLPTSINQNLEQEIVPATTMVDMGSPSQWQLLDLEASVEPIQTLTDIAWIETRNKFMPEQSKRLACKDNHGQISKQMPTVLQEWNELEL